MAGYELSVEEMLYFIIKRKDYPATMDLLRIFGDTLNGLW